MQAAQFFGVTALEQELVGHERLDVMLGPQNNRIRQRENAVRATFLRPATAADDPYAELIDVFSDGAPSPARTAARTVNVATTVANYHPLAPTPAPPPALIGAAVPLKIIIA